MTDLLSHNYCDSLNIWTEQLFCSVMKLNILENEILEAKSDSQRGQQYTWGFSVNIVNEQKV